METRYPVEAPNSAETAAFAVPPTGNPVAIVTGGGSGIGRSAARCLASRGYTLVVAGRRLEPLEETCSQIQAAGGTARAAQCDLGLPQAPAGLVATTFAWFGRIDAIVNSAATVSVEPMESWKASEIDEHMALNVRCPFLLVQAALPHLRCSTNAAVVNVSSSSGSMVRPGQSIYGASKAALEYLTRSLAAELAETGIRVNAVAPGPVDTPIHLTWADDVDSAYREMAAQVPLGRVGEADELGWWIGTLIAAPAAAWVTGVVLPVDGGQVLDRQ